MGDTAVEMHQRNRLVTWGAGFVLTLCVCALRAGEELLPNPAESRAEVAVAELEDQIEHLKRHGISSDTDALLKFLRRQIPSQELRREIEQLIKRLSSASFDDRQKATDQLLKLGPVARPRLTEALKSNDPESAWRSEWILKRLDSNDARWERDSLLRAALRVFKSRREATALSELLRYFAVLEDEQLQDLACEAIWASTDATHATLLRRALRHENQQVVAVAIVAIEIALGDAGEEILESYLRDDSAFLRLAAARALVDRRPTECVIALVKLVADEDRRVVWQADALLQMVSGKQMEPTDEITLAAAWRAWSLKELPTVGRRVPLGRNRLDLMAGRYSLHETFSRPAVSLAKGYGRFSYEADNKGTASVAGDRLIIDGDNDEGDQRVFITSERMIGRVEWPRSFELRTKLGGNEGNNFGWHVGVSVGRVKMLFHPGLGGGEFRAESTDTHQSFFANEVMGFTPATGVTHEMLIKVSRAEAGAEFQLTMRDAKSTSVFNRRFTVTEAQLGKFNRIGLERSGRRGADAIFDSVSIRLQR